MDSLLLLTVMGICTAFNFVIIISKYRKGRYADSTLDLFLLGVIGFLFSSGINALSIGMIASFFISAYLWFRPIILFKKKDTYEEVEEW